MRLLTIALLSLVAHGALAQDNPFANDREGKSFVVSKGDLAKLQAAERRSPPASVTAAYLEMLKARPALATAQDACSFTLVDDWTARTNALPGYRGEVELSLKALRKYNLIDDVVLKLALRAQSVRALQTPGLRDDIRTGADAGAYKPFLDYSQRRARGKCLEDNFRDLVQAYKSRDAKVTPSNVLAWADDANRHGVLSDRALDELLQAKELKLPEWEIDLGDYIQKRQFMRTQFPVARAGEAADWVTLKTAKTKSSHRQRLYEQYTPVQMALMGDVVKKLKTRLDSPKIEILVHDNSDQVIETISLDPMERFRFALRVLRKEMRLLATNSYFAGRQPSYTDLMSAAFEMSIVTAKEIDEVAGLEEIWNPHKTFLQKVAGWVQSFGGVLAVVIPPPYGFIPTLAIIGMQAVTSENPDDTTDSLF